MLYDVDIGEIMTARELEMAITDIQSRHEKRQRIDVYVLTPKSVALAYPHFASYQIDNSEPIVDNEGQSLIMARCLYKVVGLRD